MPEPRFTHFYIQPGAEAKETNKAQLTLSKGLQFKAGGKHVF